MNGLETFGECLRRLLEAEGISASEAARLVGFRSRNSIFRILWDDASAEVDARFLTALRGKLEQQWPAQHWIALEDALDRKRVGLQQHMSNQGFLQLLSPVTEDLQPCMLLNHPAATGRSGRPLQALLTELAQDASLEIIMTGCCTGGVIQELLRTLEPHAQEGKVSICHYVYAGEDEVTQNILSTLPLLTRPWYNACLLDAGTSPPEMLSLYRTGMIYIKRTQSWGTVAWHVLLQYEKNRFMQLQMAGAQRLAELLDACRGGRELLKPMPAENVDVQDYLAYTRQYAELERDCLICSIKPDIHINCLPVELLAASMSEGLAQAGEDAGKELQALWDTLVQVHADRYRNMSCKRRPTHLVYSLSAMERFMRTGVQSDHFFLQRPYTPEERRRIIRSLKEQMLDDPYFNLYFLKPECSAVRNEITLYGKKGVLMLDAHTGYALHGGHSEALITLPGFVQAFQRFFMEELLQKHVISRTETLKALDWLMSCC